MLCVLEEGLIGGLRGGICGYSLVHIYITSSLIKRSRILFMSLTLRVGAFF